ncbi:MAG: hypothetical protein UW64_C0023G0011 [Microgenomates group bacterium GW2011_GWC1_44_37]|nr:MAG: hypothetical protein UW64_C0023G0011 [Microgenomates group bacterium GW2011_GWC1_44_37]
MHLTVVQNKRRPNQKIFTIWPGQSEFFFGNRFEIRLSPTSIEYQSWTALTEPITFFAISDDPETDETIEIIFDDSPFE